MAARDLLPSRRGVVAIVVASVVLGLLSFAYRWLDDLAREHAGRMGIRLVEEMTSALSAALLLPFVIGFARRFSVTRATLWPRLLVHLGAATVWSGALTTLRWGSRTLVCWLFGMPHTTTGSCRSATRWSTRMTSSGTPSS